MKKLTIGSILNDYQNVLTDSEIKAVQQIQTQPTKFSSQVRDLHRALFDEESDFMMDSMSDAKDRARGKNPMSQEYSVRVNNKRKAFGVSPLNAVGTAKDNSSEEFCAEVVRFTKNYQELKDLKKRNAKQVVYVDMDGVLVNFQSGIDKISQEEYDKHGPDDLDEVPGIFSLMEPNDGAIESFEWLSKNFDTYILSTASWGNPSAWTDKLLWVKKYLPESAYKRLILSHNKHLAQGDFLIDDRTKNGAGKFPGKHIHFGPKGHKDFPDWQGVINYMKHLA